MIYPECDMMRWEICASAFIPTIDDYYTKKQINDIIENLETSAITSAEVETLISEAISGKADSTAVTEEISAAVSGKVDEQQLENYALKTEIPTSNSAFTNDMGYLTEHQSLSAYSTTQQMNEAISAATSTKADVTALNDYLLKSKIWHGTKAQYDAIQNKDADTIYFIYV